MSRTVLIVDDEKAIVEILRFNLEKAGYSALCAYDGIEGLRLAKEQKPDLTYQHAATDKLKDVMLETISERLQKSGRFDFVDRRADRLIVNDWTEERDGAIVSDELSEPLKNGQGADYILHATLNEFREGDGRTHDVYYKMSARLINKKTKKNDWVGSKEIRKVSKRSVIGW